MKRYYDYEHDRIVHENELIAEFSAMSEDATSATTAQEYIENCQSDNGGTLIEMSGADTGWMDTVTGIVYTQEQMHQQYTRILDLTDQYDNFADFLAEVTDINGPFRRVI